MALTSEDSELAFQSCEPCKSRKKKCDRVFPACTTCRKKLLRCVYEDTTQSELRRLRAQVDHFTKLLKNGSMSTYLPTLGLLNVDPPVPYPIQSRWYMPFLLQHHRELITPTFSRPEPTEESFPPISWMQTPFSDACMFNAVLYAASSHLDVIRRERDNPITQYHRRNIVRLLLGSISESGKVPDTSIAATMYLWHYESMNWQTEEAGIHKSGLKQMVKARGGLENLGMDGFLAHLITLIDIGDGILNMSPPAFPNPAQLMSPLTPMTLLLSTLDKPERELNTDRIPIWLLDLLRQVHETTLTFEYLIMGRMRARAPTLALRESVLKYMSGVVSEHELLSIDDQKTRSPFHVASVCAANIHLRSMGKVVPFSSEGNQGLVDQLRQSLSEFGNETWHETDPEIYIFLCFTGAAAAQEGKSWFIAKSGPLIMSLRKNEQQLFKTAALRFCNIYQYLEGLGV